MPMLVNAEGPNGENDGNNDQKSYSIKYEATFSLGELIFGRYNEYDIVELNESSCINEIGKPKLPAKELKIALPSGMAVKQVQVIDAKNEIIKGDYNIYPAQPPISPNGEHKIEPFVKPDEKTYNLKEQYPNNLVEFVFQTDLAGQSIVVIHLFPVQYIPYEKKLIMYTKITFNIIGEEGYICGDYLPDVLPENGRKNYEKLIKDIVDNPGDVELSTVGYNEPMNFLLPSGGPYNHVIITSSNHESYWSPLVEWRTKKGLSSMVVTTDYICSNYAGVDNQEKIRNFVIDAHTNWGTLYFLMAGEHNTVPFEYRNYYENAPSDMYYGDYDDDWTYEVFVGRSTAEGLTEINTFIDKVINYEKNPPVSNYILDVLLIGMDTDSATELELLKEDVDGYIPSRFDVTKVYDSHTGNHKTEVINALNDGQHLVNHADHGFWNYMGTGDFNHGWGITDTDVDALKNDGQPSIVVTLACLVNYMDISDCIAEHFVVYNPNQAGVAYTGNTRSGLYYEGNDQYPYYLSNKLDYWWWRSFFTEDKYIIGETLAATKHHFGTDPWNPNAGRHCVWEFNLLGEPSMPIWTDTPKTLDVTHPTYLPTDNYEPASFTVHVDEEGVPVDQALVCIWKNDEVYEVGNTDINGDITFYPEPSTEGVMYVTVTKHNYLPYEGEAFVAEFVLNLADFPMYEAESDPGYNEMCGPSVAQMALNYMWWNMSQDPEAPMMYTQTELYNSGMGNNSDPTIPYFDTQSMWHTIQYLDPGPYSEYGYNFNKRHSTDSNYVLKHICQWINYTVGTVSGGHKPGHPPQVPSVVPAYGDYSNWMAIRGIHTNQPAYPLPDELDIYGFWVNDPFPSGLGGIGENSYKTVDEWLLTYYHTLTSNDIYNGEYVAIVEPPSENLNTKVTKLHSPNRLTIAESNCIKYIRKIYSSEEKIPNEIKTAIYGWITRAAIEGVSGELVPYDKEFAKLFEGSIPGEPMFVKGINDNDYYIVPFNIPRDPYEIKNADTSRKTIIVVIVDAEEGHFKEASWVDIPMKYLPVSEKDAKLILYKTFREQGIDWESIENAETELVHRSKTPYYPDLKITLKDRVFYIGQDGTINNST